MRDFQSFKQRRLRQDPTAAKYSDYEWERAYKAYLSARGHSVETPSDSSSGAGGINRSRGRAKGKASGAGIELDQVPAGFRTACIIGWAGGFFVSVILGWFISTMGGGAAGLIGFLAGCALLTFFSALVGLLFTLMRQQMQLQQSLDALHAAYRSEMMGKRPSSESES